MKAKPRSMARVVLTTGLCASLAVAIAVFRPTQPALGDPPIWHTQDYCGFGEEPPSLEVGGCWYWLRSPEQEKRVVMALFNRYCIRCHGVDGRGVWDIPDVPNFTNPRWQACRTDGELARAILEGRGSVMPPWRGTLSLEEAWAIARYVRTFVPGTEMSRPDFNAPPNTRSTNGSAGTCRGSAGCCTTRLDTAAARGKSRLLRTPPDLPFFAGTAADPIRSSTTSSTDDATDSVLVGKPTRSVCSAVSRCLRSRLRKTARFR